MIRKRGRRTAIALTLLAAAVVATPAPAEFLSGPRLAFLRWGPGDRQIEILSTDASGSDLQMIAGGKNPRPPGVPLPFDGPSWSPDGNLIAFSGYYTSKKYRIFVATADGSAIWSIPGTKQGDEPVFAPDGRRIAFSRTRLETRRGKSRSGKSTSFFGTTTWIVDIESGVSRQLTPWRNGLILSPSSFSPDGSELALSRIGRGRPDAVAMRLANRQMSVIARGAESPVYSPDGQWIALLAYRSKNVGGRDGFFLATDLYVKSASRRGLRQLTRTANRWESSPSWEPSGERIAYTQDTTDEILPFGFTNVVMEINRDGTCATKVFDRARPNGSSAASLYGPAWQPGIGREAGRIPC